MPTQAIPVGMQVTLLANVVYALPPVKCTLYTDTATPTITQSNTLAFTNSTAVTVTAGVASVLGGLFVKCTADTVVVCKRD